VQVEGGAASDRVPLARADSGLMGAGAGATRLGFRIVGEVRSCSRDGGGVASTTVSQRAGWREGGLPNTWRASSGVAHTRPGLERSIVIPLLTLSACLSCCFLDFLFIFIFVFFDISFQVFSEMELHYNKNV
jgi:hypothetical protein